MGIAMDQDALKALATELAKSIKTEKDLGDLTQQRVKLTVETALNAELGDYLGYAKHDPSGRGTGNGRNGIARKVRSDGPATALPADVVISMLLLLDESIRNLHFILFELSAGLQALRYPRSRTCSAVVQGVGTMARCRSSSCNNTRNCAFTALSTRMGKCFGFSDA